MKYETVDLDAPFETDTVLQVRTGKLKRLEGLSIESGIDKGLRDGDVPISLGGLDADEHDYTFHGGPEKAIHAYCCSHYPSWQNQFPQAAEKFRPGGFGENFVVQHMNERNVCIGDIHAVGEEVLLQVSLPRQPCFKLNHRFSLKNFAPNTWKQSRTGWYYRVLRQGRVKAGDKIKLVERPYPQWTIERVQEYLHRNKQDHAMNKELAGIKELGEESRGEFRGRVAKKKLQEKRALLGEETPVARWIDYTIAERVVETPRIISLRLKSANPDPDADRLWPGAQAKIKLGNGLVRSYSIVSGDRNAFQLGIALDESSRGGSKYLHEQIKVGDVVQVGRITADVPMASAASNHIFIAGGIGITAFLALVQGYRAINYNYELHYAVRSAADVPFAAQLEAARQHTTLYDGARGERMDLEAILRGRSWNSQVYVCGPARLMAAARRAAEACGVAEGEVHYEAFTADTSGEPFEVTVANRGGRTVRVSEEETLLEVLRRSFGEEDVPSSCEVGNCGTCKIVVLEGRVDHRGSALTGEEKSGSMLSCVSRGIGPIVVEI